MKLFLVRHPETSRNLRNKLTGWERTIYTERGKNQFSKIFAFFNGYKNKVYSSDLSRCLRLAKEISRHNKSKLVITDLLRERNFKETKPKEHFETHEEFKNRIDKFIEEYNPKSCLIVSHAGVIRLLINEVLNEEETKKHINLPRDHIFVIETNKKQKLLRSIKV